ncbi:MAG TPA: S9 family peptidase [Gemmatimonadales bacterium]|nr:S9 family peptidase [Gemmatimonadales bacterium]HRX19942.1 S9 family peptidase [Gemmatimonadales bacterium]
MPRLAVLAAAVLLLPATAAAQQGRAFTPADWYRVTTLSSPAMSPDGRLVAVTVTTVKEKENTRHSEVWVVPAAGGEAVRYTSPSTESSNPRWSHDGTYLFFTSRREGGDGTTWALRMDVPAGEAQQLTTYPSGSIPRDGAFAVFTAPADGDEDDEAEAKDSTVKDPYQKMPAMARPPFAAITTPLDPRRFDGRHIVDLGYKANGRGFVPNRREPRTDRPQQLWRQPFGDTAKTRLTDTPYSHRSAVVSPDGRWIAFVADARLRPDSVVRAERDSLAPLPYDAARDEAPRNDTDIFVIAIDGGTPRRLTTLDGNEGSLAWSPDGRSLAFTSSTTRTGQEELRIVDVAGGTPREVIGDWRYEPGDIAWTPDGQILMTAAIGGRTALFRVDPRTGALQELLGGRRRITGTAYDTAYSRVAFVATSIDAPTELFIANIDGTGERQLTSFNTALNEEIAWSDAERFTYESVGGVEIEGWLMKPYGYQPGIKYPLAFYIHGGPHSSYGEGWFDEFQNLAGAGMWVLFTNPRGSSGYGAEFTYATRGRWGMEDYEDLMRAVDLTAARPDVDSTRMGVTGGSYGGFMTAWITTKTDRFKAAQTDRMISNWFSWYGVSDAQGLTEFEFYGKPWDNPTLYWDLSPLAHVARVRTPTLIVQSEEDHRTPMADAEQWFMALRKQGVPVEFVRYPRSTHDLSRTGEPWLLVDRLGRLRQWFGHWLEVPGVGKP